MKFLRHHFAKDLVLIIDLKQEGHDQKCAINTGSFAIIDDLEKEFEIRHRYLRHKVLVNLLLLFQSVSPRVSFIIVGYWLNQV